MGVYLQLLGMFMARAVADDCLPPKYIQSYKGTCDNKAKQEALEKAELLLGQKHGIVRLDNIWGIGGGIRPVKYLVKQVMDLRGGGGIRPVKYLVKQVTVLWGGRHPACQIPCQTGNCLMGWATSGLSNTLLNR